MNLRTLFPSLENFMKLFDFSVRRYVISTNFLFNSHEWLVGVKWMNSPSLERFVIKFCFFPMLAVTVQTGVRRRVIKVPPLTNRDVIAVVSEPPLEPNFEGRTFHSSGVQRIGS